LLGAEPAPGFLSGSEAPHTACFRGLTLLLARAIIRASRKPSVSPVWEGFGAANTQT
jgi:hypothetical protein